MKRTFTLNNGITVQLESLQGFGQENFPPYEVEAKGWFIPTKNSKEGDYFILDGEKYVFKYKSKDGKSDIFETEEPPASQSSSSHS